MSKKSDRKKKKRREKRKEQQEEKKPDIYKFIHDFEKETGPYNKD